MSPADPSPPGPTAELEVIHDDEVLVMGTARNVLFGGWKEAPTVTTLRIMEVAGRKYERKQGSLALFNVAYDGTPSFSEEVRRETARLTGDPALFPAVARPRRAHPRVQGGSGAGRSSTRSSCSGARLTPTGMLGSAEAAIEWLVPALEPTDAGWTAASLKAEADALEQAACR